jgi:hypothetical protein
MPRGYDRALYILPFDHRGSFQAKMFGWKLPLSEEQRAEISRAKEVIYDGFNSALANGLPQLASKQSPRSPSAIASTSICLSEQTRVYLLNSQIAPARDITPQRRPDTCS